MSSVWQQEPSGYSPCVEIDSSSVRTKDRLCSPGWLKQEQDDLHIIKWENFQTAASADAVQDNTPSSAMSGKQQWHLIFIHWCDETSDWYSMSWNQKVRTLWVVTYAWSILLSQAASHAENLPPRVLLTITKLQCMLESKQERISALERQVEDLMQDRKFLRSQIENLTSTRTMSTFASPSSVFEGWWLSWSCRLFDLIFCWMLLLVVFLFITCSS